MPNNLSVTLNKAQSPWSVDVDQHGNDNEVSQGPTAQTITWQLSGNAASGSFAPINGNANPGFAWISAPPDGIFGPPTLSGNGNTLTMTDLNSGSSTSGMWTYVLRVNVDGTVYSTKTLSIGATDTNPWIKNK